ncbi:hypothetical protein QJQ45_024490 [Haematococcus lacustris]|nr:hypothetical protein QJQ45_024490 [Haematococcus lacustris]
MVVEDPPSDIPKEASGKPTCPICAYIEAGPCKQEHQDWTSCREQAKVEGKDHLDVCQDVRKTPAGTLCPSRTGRNRAR